MFLPNYLIHRYRLVLLPLSLAMLFGACDTRSDKEEGNKPSFETSPYLAQQPPGLTPEPFAPHMVSTPNWEYSGVFSPDMHEFYFLREVVDAKGDSKQEFVVYEKKNNKWEERVLSSRRGQPFVSPDGKTMHLGNRYMMRTKTGWSKEEKLSAPFENFPIMRLTSSSEGTYYFDEFKSDLTGDIRYSRLVNGHYEEPKLMNKEINTGRSFHPFIAPDESYLLFDSYREGGFGDSDIYISYRQQDGSWGHPINLGDKINTQAWEASATITPDGKYLFFNRIVGPKDEWNVDIFWVDAKVIEDLRNN